MNQCRQYRISDAEIKQIAGALSIAQAAAEKAGRIGDAANVYALRLRLTRPAQADAAKKQAPTMPIQGRNGAGPARSMAASAAA